MNAWRNSYLTIVTAVAVAALPGAMCGAEMQPFTGEKTTWHGFDRYDFFMSEDLVIEPTKAAPEEGNGFKHREGNQRRCIVVVPKTAAAGNPW